MASLAPEKAPENDIEANGTTCKPSTLQVSDMGYTVGGKEILSNVNAVFEPRQVTAVMGACVCSQRCKGSSRGIACRLLRRWQNNHAQRNRWPRARRNHWHNLGGRFVIYILLVPA